MKPTIEDNLRIALLPILTQLVTDCTIRHQEDVEAINKGGTPYLRSTHMFYNKAIFAIKEYYLGLLPKGKDISPNDYGSIDYDVGHNAAIQEMREKISHE